MTLRPLYYDVANQRLAEAVNQTVNPATIGSYMGRNKLINGNFLFWQRATSSTAAGYCADRWATFNDGATFTTSQQNSDSDLLPRPYFFRQVVTSLGSGLTTRQAVEGVRTVYGKHTFSILARSSTNSKLDVSVTQVFGAGGSAPNGLTPVTLQLTSEWKWYSVVFDVPTTAGKTLGSSNFLATTFRFTETGTYDIGAAQLELGEDFTVFEDRPIGLEFMLCQRYCQVDQTGVNGTTRVNMGAAFFFSATRADAIYTFKQPMRVPPAVIFSAAASWRVLRSGGAAVVSAISAGEVSTSNMYVTATVAGQTAATPGMLQTTDAVASGTGITLDAEL